MKDTLLSFICALALLVSGCSKQELATPEEERFTVTMNVNSLSHHIVPMAGIQPMGAKIGANASDRKLSDVVDYLYYYVFKEDGEKLVERVQSSMDGNVGQIMDRFGKGKYTVLLLGRSQQQYDSYWAYNDQTWFSNYGLTDDVFYKRIDLVVTDSNVEQDVVLERKTGMIALELTDKVPPHISEIRFSIIGVSNHFIPKTNRGENNQTSSRSTYFYGDGTPYYMDLGEPYAYYFFLDQDEEALATVNLSAFDQDQKLVAERLIKNVPVAVNKRTKLRGRLFEESGNISAQIFSVNF